MERPGEYVVPEINAPNAPADAGAHRSISVDVYGLKTFGLLFSSRQLLAMQTFVAQLHEAILAIERRGSDVEYHSAIVAYLGLWISRIAQRGSNLGVWHTSRETLEHPFGRQAIPMTWDYPEANPFSEATGGAEGGIDWILRVIEHESGKSNVFPLPARVFHGDGAGLPLSNATVDAVVTDPPYFDAVAYADLSDFFYIWLKRGIGDVFSEAFATPQTPKAEEAVAHKHRHHGDRDQGKRHFQHKLTECLSEAKRVCKADSTIAIMFAHQSTEAWTALIGSVFASGLTVTATYPIDTEMTTALKRNISALESSITVICRAREADAAAAFRDVRREIERAVTNSVHRFWDYGFRGADLIVACYGPAVGVFGRYERVERADGTPVGVPELLQLVRESALKAIAGEFTGDPLSRLYFVWANLYGTGEQAWDDARLVVQVGGDSDEAMEVARRHDLFVVDGATCRLALLRDRVGKRSLGADPTAPLIDQLHHAMQLWKAEQRDELLVYLRDHELIDHASFWKLAQALFEVLPRGEEDWKLISVLLGERETLRSQVRRLGTLG